MICELLIILAIILVLLSNLGCFLKIILSISGIIVLLLYFRKKNYDLPKDLKTTIENSKKFPFIFQVKYGTLDPYEIYESEVNA